MGTNSILHPPIALQTSSRQFPAEEQSIVTVLNLRHATQTVEHVLPFAFL
jgi:hypothetical protein